MTSERPEPKVFDLVYHRGVWVTIEGFGEDRGTELSTGQWVRASELKPIMSGRWRYEPKRECTCIGGPERDDSGEMLHAGYCVADDRRERYAAEMRPVLEAFVKRPYITGALDALTSAATAVADEEVSRAVGDRAALVAENARLRAELEATRRAKRENDDRFQGQAADLREENARLRAEVEEYERRYRSSVETYQDMSAEFSKILRWREEDAKEIARLRGELAKTEDYAERLLESNAYLHRTLDTVQHDKAISDRTGSEHLATIERVRAVLNEDPGWSPAELKRRIREALNGPTSVANPNRTQVTE
ncbi:hypothetical protein [Streptomyces malaysiensis]